MPSDLASLLNKPVSVDLAGRTLQVYPISLDDMAELQKWINEQRIDPYEIVLRKIDRIPPELRQKALDGALEKSLKMPPPPRLGSDEASALLGTPEAFREVVYLSLRRGDPSLSREGVAALFRELSIPDIEKLSRVMADFFPDAARDGGPGDPKGGATPTRATGGAGAAGASDGANRPPTTGA